MHLYKLLAVRHLLYEYHLYESLYEHRHEHLYERLQDPAGSKSATGTPTRRRCNLRHMRS